jgi:hypothetical protein
VGTNVDNQLETGYRLLRRDWSPASITSHHRLSHVLCAINSRLFGLKDFLLLYSIYNTRRAVPTNGLFRRRVGGGRGAQD